MDYIEEIGNFFDNPVVSFLFGIVAIIIAIVVGLIIWFGLWYLAYRTFSDLGWLNC